MIHSCIAFPNLRAEMARKGVSIQDIARELKKDRTTIGAKLSGKRPIHLEEAFAIIDAFFPELDVHYLFAK